MASKWITEDENFCGETQLTNGDTLKLWDTRKRLDVEKQILYPVMIYRRFRKNVLIDSHTNPISMRYWYPDQFKELIESRGFKIIGAWGGYQGEDYGKGPELVVTFKKEGALTT